MSKYFSKFVKYFQDEEKLAQKYVCECKSKNIENDNTKLEELTSSDSSSSSEQEDENQNNIIKLINENKESECSCEEYGSDEEYDEQNDDLCREWYEEILFKRIELKESIEIQQLVLLHNVQNLLSNEFLLKLHQNKQYLEVTNNIKDPQIILDYINLIWTDLTDPQLLIRHIEILSQHNPVLVPDFLKQDKYPIGILEITKKFNIQEGCAILFLKQGMIAEALDKLIEFVDDQMRYFVREQLRLPVQIQKKRKPIYQFKVVSQLIAKLQQVLQYINDFLQNNKYLEDMDILWFKYFHQMIDWQLWLDQLYKLQNTKVELIQLMNFIRVNIPNTVFQLIQSTDIDLFIEEYQLSFSKLNIATHIFNFKQITREQKYHKKILKLCYNEIQCTNQMIKEILTIRKSRGRIIQIQCSECSLFGHMIPINQSGNYNSKIRVIKYDCILMQSYISFILYSKLIVLQYMPNG